MAIGLSVLLVLPLRWLPPLTSSFMLQSYANSGQFYAYRWRSYGDISPYMALAAIAAEDQRFPKHQGFDLRELERAIEDYQEGEALRGASTISQQVAKNLYLWSEQTIARKAIEAWLTVLIEAFWSKQRILEVYLNIAQFDEHTFGVESASWHFFDRPAADLSPEEAALLAAVLPGPELYDAAQPSLEVLQRQAWILQQMNQLGGLDYLTQLQTPN
ncbi:MAG: monofunctional biosynthetic peptidoglycan transglycosylase [Elainellaceae cyanobacterium]